MVTPGQHGVQVQTYCEKELGVRKLSRGDRRQRRMDWERREGGIEREREGDGEKGRERERERK